jgi:hypothetical protein
VPCAAEEAGEREASRWGGLAGEGSAESVRWLMSTEVFLDTSREAAAPRVGELTPKRVDETPPLPRLPGPPGREAREELSEEGTAGAGREKESGTTTVRQRRIG